MSWLRIGLPKDYWPVAKVRSKTIIWCSTVDLISKNIMICGTGRWLVNEHSMVIGGGYATSKWQRFDVYHLFVAQVVCWLCALAPSAIQLVCGDVWAELQPTNPAKALLPPTYAYLNRLPQKYNLWKKKNCAAPVYEWTTCQIVTGGKCQMFSR